MAAYAASDSKKLILNSLRLAWVVLQSWTLRKCMSSISWLWFGSGVIIRVLIRNSILMSWSRAISMCWAAFSHIVCISWVELFSPCVNMDFPRDLGIPGLTFYFLELACCNMTLYMSLPFTELLHFPEPPPLPEPPLPLPTAEDCRQLYWPCFILDQRSLNLRCQWYSFFLLSTFNTLYLVVGCALVSLCL